MKLKCKQDHWPATAGVFGVGAKPRIKIDGLTEGKEYEATPVSLTSGSMVDGIGNVETVVHFLIYNDDGVWENYQMNLFEPA